MRRAFLYCLLSSVILCASVVSLFAQSTSLSLAKCAIHQEFELKDAVPLFLGAGSDAQFRWSTADASNHVLVLGLDNTSQQFHITDKGAVATDWARTAGTHPELAIHSNTTPITDYLKIGNHDGTDAYLDVVGGTGLNFLVAGTAIAEVTTLGVGMKVDDDGYWVGASDDAGFVWQDGDDSNHAAVIAIGDTSQQIHITDKAAVATDWTRTAGTHPELSIHSNTTPITDYLAIGNHDGTTASLDVVGGTTLDLNVAGTTRLALTANGRDGYVDRSTYSEMYDELDQAAGTTPHGRWVLNEETANTTNDFMASEPSGAYSLAFSTDNEAQANQLSFGDNLMIDMDENPIVEFRIRVDNGGINSVEKIYFGVCPAHTNAEASMDNIDDSCFFMLDGSATWTDIVVQSDDGSNDESEDSTIDLVDDAWTVFRIDFSDLADVVMSVDGVQESGASTLDMTASAGTATQVVIVIQRSDNSQTEAITPIEIDYVQVIQDR